MPRIRCIDGRIGHLALRAGDRDHDLVPIEDRDLTTIMAMLGDIRGDVHTIRKLLEDDGNGEEEETSEDQP
jgi:hypothetical protein